MAVTNNLYPPIINTYMPAFLIDDGKCNVYFSLSNFNSESDIKNVQVTILNQNTNLSALDSNKYPSGIMLTSLQKDTTRVSDDKYYITINSSDLIGEDFIIDQYYKIQLRFTHKDAADVALTTPQSINGWLASNLEYFSEWSTVCLIYGISTPVLSIVGFDTLQTEAVWSTSNVELIGKIDFVDSAEVETLKSYRIKLYKRATDELLLDSGNLYSNSLNDINQFNYRINYYLENGQRYYFTIEYTTKNLYQATETYYALASRDSSLPFVVTAFTPSLDIEEGRIKLNIKTEDVFNDTLVILRASSQTNFTIWEDVHIIDLNESKLDYTWYDRTIESGILYKYGVQRRHSNKASKILESENEMGIVLEYSYLTKDNRQLKIKFNESVSSMKRAYMDNKIDTLGSQFPIIKRNGVANYRTFPIAGLISYMADEKELFTSKEEIYGKDNVKLYEEFNDVFNIKDVNDYTYEREFRKKVSEFLSDGSVKLFRSPTEGNILVRLVDVNFTPNTNLGRYIWNFNCTAYEMDDCSIHNFDKYEIQTIKKEI